MTWLAVIGGVIQLVFLILSNNFSKDREKKEENDKRHKEIADDLFSRDKSRITAGLDRLRNK